MNYLFRLLLLLSWSSMTIASTRAEEQPTGSASLLKAVTLYASFDEAIRADFGGGILAPSTRFNHETDSGRYVVTPGVDEKYFRIAAGKGVHGGVLEPTDLLPRNGRIFFPAKGNISFQPGGWGGAASFWLNTDPNRLLKTRFCDPVQITEKGANNGGLWFDFNDAMPRDARMGVFSAVPDGGQPIKESDPQAPLVKVPRVGFESGQWHHIALNWRNFDSNRADAEASLYIDGNRSGGVQGQAIAMNWNLDKAGIYVAVNYFGLFDELAIFSRTLTATEIELLHRQPKILADLKK